MIERKPSPAPERSLKSLEAGLALFPHFRKHISSSGPVTAAQVAELLGHNSIRMVEQHYGHLSQKVGAMREAAKKAVG